MSVHIMKTSRENIFEAALELFSKFGYFGTTVAQIAKRSGLSNGALYRHFTGKRELAEEIYREVMTSLLQAFRQIREDNLDFKGKLELVVNYLLGIAAEHPQRINFIFFLKHSEFLSPPQLKLTRDVCEEIKMMVAAAAETGEIADMNPQFGAAMIMGTINKLIEMHNFKLLNDSLEDMTKQCQNLFLNGLSCKSD